MNVSDPANIAVFCVMAAFILFVIYVVIQSRAAEKRDKNNEIKK